MREEEAQHGQYLCELQPTRAQCRTLVYNRDIKPIHLQKSVGKLRNFELAIPKMTKYYILEVEIIEKRKTRSLKEVIISKINGTICYAFNGHLHATVKLYYKVFYGVTNARVVHAQG